MKIEPGQVFLHYRIVDKIGEGGMGEVWRAFDTTLDREVAIKLLPAALADDRERLARFEREAKLLASLNHPNIATIHGLHEHRGLRFLAMELVGGEDLAQRLERGPIPQDQAIAIAASIAEGLEAAHESGVIHRDLKPANVKLATDGRVKLLDFGLAKALLPEAPGGVVDNSLSPTVTSAGTIAGVILGTAGYMSPEQARGHAVDRRTDIWAFGCVLFEMLTGQRAYGGDTVTDVIAAVVTRDPDWDDLPPSTSPTVRRLLERCFDKHARNRLRDIGEARIVLEGGHESVDQPETTPPPPAKRSPLGIAVLLLAAVVAGALAAWFLRPVAPVPLRKLALALPAGMEGPRSDASISPNGDALAYTADGQLWIHNLDSLTPRLVPGGEGASRLTWSPDGDAVAFTVRTKLWRTLPSGEPALIADLPAAIGASGSISWTDDGRIVYSTGDDHLYHVAVAGGTPSILLKRETAAEIDFHEPLALPGDNGILFTIHSREGAVDKIQVVRDGKRKTVFTEQGASISRPTYSPTGHLLFERTDSSSGLWALPFSLTDLAPTGEAFLVTGVGSAPNVSRDGSLLYSNVSTVGNHGLVFVDRAGEVVERIGEPVTHADNATLSPDGRQFATCIVESREDSMWVYDLERDARSRLSATGDCGGSRGQLAWSPDGSVVAFGDSSTGRIRLWRVDGSTEELETTEGQQPTFTPDGRFIVYVRTDPETQEDLWYFPVDGGAEPAPFVVSPARELEPHCSPGGDHVAYVSDDDGRSDIFLRTFPGGSAVWRVSVDGGNFPRWSASGDRLYYLQDEAVAMEVDVATVPTVRLSDPRQLWEATPGRLGPNHGWDVVGEGERFLTVELADIAASGGDLTLVTGWDPDSEGRR